MEKPSPPQLKDCLAALPIRRLWVIARLHDIGCGHQVRKAELVERLAAALLRPETVKRALRQLTPDQRRALDALIAAGGRMGWPAFRDQFGDIRPYRPWQDDAPRHPWHDPISPAEALWFRGLIFRRPRRPRSGQDVHVLIPADLLALLPSPPGLSTPDPLATLQRREAATRGDLVTDVALFLSLLHRADIRPLWERWLPPRYLRELNQRLSVSEDVGQARSELQTGRLRFIHFLAETAGLVSLAGRWLKPTPSAWAWLDRAPALRPSTDRRGELVEPSGHRYQTLWSAWCHLSDANEKLWQQFRLPGHNTGVALDILDVVLDRLAELAAEERYAVTPFVAAVVETEWVLSSLPSIWRADEPYDQGPEIVLELLKGPLTWWGAVVVDEQAGGPAFAVTPLGRWLLTGESVWAPPAEELFSVDDDLAIRVPDGADPRDLVRIEALAEWRGWLEGRPVCRAGTGRRCYQVTPDSLSRALSRSTSLSEIVHTLAGGQGGKLGPVPSALLQAWADETQAVSLRRVTLLETRDAERLRQMSANRAIHKFFRETLSPRAVVVDADRVGHLARALKRQGIWPRVDLPMGEPGDEPAGEAGAAVLWIAGRVYARLSRWIDLPQRMPAALLDDLAAQMSPATYAAARQAVEDAIDRLAATMDGWALHPMPEAGLPPEETLPVIEQAIVEGRTLHLTYWTAGRGERTTRTVEPYRIEWRGDVPYLIAYCHERLEDRVFRVDRISRLQVAG